MWIEPVPESAAEGLLADLYAQDRRARGYLPNYSLAFSHRPDAYQAWRTLVGAVQRSIGDARRYELATVAAARALGSSYCSLAHASALLEFFDADELHAVITDRDGGVLEPVDVAIMDLAEKVANDAQTVQQSDIERLRDFGMSDGEILDVILAASVRSFFSKVLDAVGAQPDSTYLELDLPLRELLVVGRPIAQPPDPTG